MPDSSHFKIAEAQKKLPNYEIREHLGDDILGSNFLANRFSSDDSVIIRILSPIICENEVFFGEVTQTVKYLLKKQEKGILEILDWGRTGDSLFIVYEHVFGKSFYEYCSNTESIPEKIEMLMKVCDVLQELHLAQLPYLALNPHSLLVLESLDLKISDVGLIKALKKERFAISEMLSTNYTAPEVLDIESIADYRADIYSVGVILYEILTKKTLSSEYESVGSLGEINGSNFDSIIRKSTNPSPSNRHFTITEFKEELSKLLSMAVLNEVSEKPVEVNEKVEVIPVESQIEESKEVKKGTKPQPFSPESKAPKKSKKGSGGKIVVTLVFLFLIGLTYVKVIKPILKELEAEKAGKALRPSIAAPKIKKSEVLKTLKKSEEGAADKKDQKIEVEAEVEAKVEAKVEEKVILFSHEDFLKERYIKTKENLSFYSKIYHKSVSSNNIRFVTAMRAAAHRLPIEERKKHMTQIEELEMRVNREGKVPKKIPFIHAMVNSEWSNFSSEQAEIEQQFKGEIKTERDVHVKLVERALDKLSEKHHKDSIKSLEKELESSNKVMHFIKILGLKESTFN